MVKKRPIFLAAKSVRAQETNSKVFQVSWPTAVDEI